MMCDVCKDAAHLLESQLTEMRVFTAAAAAAAASVTATDTDTQHDMMSFELVCPFIHLSD